MKQLKYGILYEDGPLHPELTPLDLFCAGYIIRRHRDGVSWCYWRKNPYDPNGLGEIFGKPCATVEAAIESARWMMSARTEQQMLLGAA